MDVGFADPPVIVARSFCRFPLEGGRGDLCLPGWCCRQVALASRNLLLTTLALLLQVLPRGRTGELASLEGVAEGGVGFADPPASSQRSSAVPLESGTCFGAWRVLQTGSLASRIPLRRRSDGCDPETPVSERMASAPDTIDADAPVREAALWMLETGYRHLPVVENDELLGIIDSRDVLWAVVAKD